MHKAKVKDQEAKNALFRPDWTKVMNDTTIQKNAVSSLLYICMYISIYFYMCVVCNQ